MEIINIGKVQKLVPNLKDKKTYVVHIRYLDQALKNSVRLKQYIGFIDLNKTI